MSEMSDAVSPSHGSVASNDSTLRGIHATVVEAVGKMWNNEYDAAAALLQDKKDANPRYALEWANLGLVKSLMSSTNEERERLLDLFKIADTLATAAKYNEPMFDSPDDEDDDDGDDDGNDSDDTATDALDNASNTAASPSSSRGGGGSSSTSAPPASSSQNASMRSNNTTTTTTSSNGGGGVVSASNGSRAASSSTSNAAGATTRSDKAAVKAAVKAAAKARHRNKKAFKARKKQAAKTGVQFDQAWQFECDIVYANALLMRAIAQLMMNSYLKGGINMRKAWGSYYALLQAVEKDTSNSIPYELKMCVKYGAGTFYAFLALVPANLMKLLSIIGFISDKDLGEQYLTEVFESNTVCSPFAALVLCTLYLFLPTGLGNVADTLARAKRILDTMNARYPRNTYFHGYANFYYRKKGETQAAVQSITLAAANAERVGLVPLLIKYLYADTLFMDQQWAAALAQYTALLEHLDRTREKFAYTGQVALSVAACHVMLGRNADAMTWMRKVGSMYNAKSKNDANSPKFAARVLANTKLLPLSGVYMLYINRDLAHMNTEQGKRVLSELQRVTAGADLSGSEAQNLHRLLVGVIKKGCGDTAGALQQLQAVLADEGGIAPDSMILPFTYYELAELEYHRGNLSRASDLFERGRKIKGDGNETLNNRYNIAMKQLKRRMDQADPP